MGAKGNAIPPENWIFQHAATMNKFKDVKHFKVNKTSLGMILVNQRDRRMESASKFGVSNLCRDVRQARR